MFSGLKSTSSFSNFYIEIKPIQSQVELSSLFKNWVLCSSINWPSNFVNNNACFLQVFTTLTQSQRELLKAFHGKWEDGGSFTNAFFSNLKTVNLTIFANHEGIYIWRVYSVEVLITLFTALCILCLRVKGFYAKPVFFCNISNSNLYIDALITKLF